MFCFQCQEAAHGTGCTKIGMCGKTPEVSDLQDLILYLTKGIAQYTTRLREQRQIEMPEANAFIMNALFMTITNANFDSLRFEKEILRAQELRDEARALAVREGIDISDLNCDCSNWHGSTLAEMHEKAKTVGVLATENEDIRSLRELLMYGLKGMAAYAEHAYNLGAQDESIVAFLQRALVATTQELSGDELTALVLECGQYGVKVMALLDEANTSRYGNPEITKVSLDVRDNPAILIS
ncbi:MAG: hydroxylamine reductase, partial [Bacteroidales bacterium]